MTLQQQTQTLQQQIDANKAQIGRLQGAIKYTVNSDLLFPIGRLADVCSRAADHCLAGGEIGAVPAQRDRSERLYR